MKTVIFDLGYYAHQGMSRYRPNDLKVTLNVHDGEQKLVNLTFSSPSVELMLRPDEATDLALAMLEMADVARKRGRGE